MLLKMGCNHSVSGRRRRLSLCYLRPRLHLVLKHELFGRNVLDVSVWRISLRQRLLLRLLLGRCRIFPRHLLPVATERRAERVLQPWRAAKAMSGRFRPATPARRRTVRWRRDGSENARLSEPFGAIDSNSEPFRAHVRYILLVLVLQPCSWRRGVATHRPKDRRCCLGGVQRLVEDGGLDLGRAFAPRRQLEPRYFAYPCTRMHPR
jgi:hypothetical protein